MKRVAVFLLMFIPGMVKSYSQVPSVEWIRSTYFSMQTNRQASLTLYYRLEPLNLAHNPLLLAYRGASAAASAGSVSGVYKKLQYFNAGKEDLEKAVKDQPSSAEIRFLRLATQHNAPSFLGYNHQIAEDKEQILKQLSAVAANDPNSYLYLRIIGYLLNSGLLTPAEQSRAGDLQKIFSKRS